MSQPCNLSLADDPPGGSYRGFQSHDGRAVVVLHDLTRLLHTFAAVLVSDVVGLWAALVKFLGHVVQMPAPARELRHTFCFQLLTRMSSPAAPPASHEPTAFTSLQQTLASQTASAAASSPKSLSPLFWESETLASLTSPLM
mmetsp:Transcript_142614/g.455826  ORF Transcript_142614/g.455826 Transcript_142614/m.455826 type:complete len:142 (-) Transcript_142614:11-436(-)